MSGSTPLGTVMPTAAVRRATVEGVHAPASLLGFQRDGGRRTWARTAADGHLHHLMWLETHHGTTRLRWGLADAQAGAIIWGEDRAVTDGPYALVTGTADTIHRPVRCAHFRFDEPVPTPKLDRVIDDLAADVVTIGTFLAAFPTRRALRTYLAANRDRKDRREFSHPVHLGLKLLTAAALAVVDHDPAAAQLLVDTEVAFNTSDDQRLVRLRSAVSSL